MLTKETHHYREQTQEAVGMSPQEQRNRRHILGWRRKEAGRENLNLGQSIAWI